MGVIFVTKIPVKQKTAAILLAFLWTLTQASGVSAVLCIGEDGGVSVEQSIGTKCVCPGEVSAREQSPQFNLPDKHCRDIPLTLTALAKTQTRFNVFACIPAVVSLSQVSGVSDVLRPLLLDLNAAPPYPLPLRSIVLLI